VSEVSVIMAVYNGERFLDEAIESVLNQTHREFELLIIDDGSTDRTASILAYYSGLDSRVTVIRQANLGQAAARNHALTKARNCLVAVLDADDRMLPTRLERQMAFFDENPGASAICSYCHLINATGQRVGRSENDVDVRAGILEQDLSRFLEAVHPTLMMVKEDVLALGGYNEALRLREDRDLLGRLATSGRQILCQHEFLTDYRLHGSSLTMSSVFKPSIGRRPIEINAVRRSEDDLTRRKK
jgi:glycosyltransferase involved in cell wall biosynthesis